MHRITIQGLLNEEHALLKAMEAEFNHIPLRRARAKADPQFLAVDIVSGHVFVDSQWMQYLYLRWASPHDRAELDRAVGALREKQIPDEYQFKPRTPINAVHPIEPMHFIPRLEDGNLEGDLQRVVYRLQGKGAIGITDLDLLRRGHADKLQELERFVDLQTEGIWSIGRNSAALIEFMGLCGENHMDCMSRQRHAELTHCDFLRDDVRMEGLNIPSPVMPRENLPPKKRVCF